MKAIFSLDLGVRDSSALRRGTMSWMVSLVHWDNRKSTTEGMEENSNLLRFFRRLLCVVEIMLVLRLRFPRQSTMKGVRDLLSVRSWWRKVAMVLC